MLFFCCECIIPKSGPLKCSPVLQNTTPTRTIHTDYCRCGCNCLCGENVGKFVRSVPCYYYFEIQETQRNIYRNKKEITRLSALPPPHFSRLFCIYDIRTAMPHPLFCFLPRILFEKRWNFTKIVVSSYFLFFAYICTQTPTVPLSDSVYILPKLPHTAPSYPLFFLHRHILTTYTVDTQTHIHRLTCMRLLISLFGCDFLVFDSSHPKYRGDYSIASAEYLITNTSIPSTHHRTQPNRQRESWISRNIYLAFLPLPT